MRSSIINKTLWSLVICYILAIMWVLPNNTSLLTRQWGWLLTPVANQVGLNNAWQFFSPAPASAMYFSYTLDSGEQGSVSDVLSSEFKYPEFGAEGHWSPNYNRHVYAMRFFLLDQNRIENIFAPWLCRTHPKARQVIIESVFLPVTDIENLSTHNATLNSESPGSGEIRVSCPEPEAS